MWSRNKPKGTSQVSRWVAVLKLRNLKKILEIPEPSLLKRVMQWTQRKCKLSHCMEGSRTGSCVSKLKVWVLGAGEYHKWKMPRFWIAAKYHGGLNDCMTGFFFISTFNFGENDPSEFVLCTNGDKRWWCVTHDDQHCTLIAWSKQPFFGSTMEPTPDPVLDHVLSYGNHYHKTTFHNFSFYFLKLLGTGQHCVICQDKTHLAVGTGARCVRA